ncbi:MAG: hypothetical protein AMXMBFR33_05050 [Candidatus Xenobia bacterium]
MKRRAFTLIEVTMVLAVITIVSGPFFMLFLSEYRQFARFSRKADLTNEAARAAYSVFGLASRMPDFKLDPDNHGLRFADGSHVVYRGGRLELERAGGRRPLTRSRVVDFTAIRHGDRLTLNLALECPPDQPGMPLLVVRSIFEQPERQRP